MPPAIAAEVRQSKATRREVRSRAARGGEQPAVTVGAQPNTSRVVCRPSPGPDSFPNERSALSGPRGVARLRGARAPPGGGCVEEEERESRRDRERDDEPR